MDNVNYSAKMTPVLEKAGLFEGEPFTLVDVGCSQGIDHIWRSFGKQLRAFGFDPDRTECERLQRIETNPQVHYFPMAVGLPQDHEYHRRKSAQEGGQPPYEVSAFARSSAWSLRDAIHPPPSAPPAAASATPTRIGFGDFFGQREVKDIDFVKTDTDGSDFEVLLSAESCMESHRILGFMVECNFQGSDHDTCNTFHNIDRLMKRHGFMIYAMSVNRYSRAVLPAPFVYNLAAQTRWGQPLWGDVVFLRDLAAPESCPPAPHFSAVKILKLACLYEIFSVPDCAVELLLRFAETVSPVIDPSPLLDLLTPPLRRKRLSYREYLRAVSAKSKLLLP